MLASVGKLSSMVEMFTSSEAASEPPGERHTSVFDSSLDRVHFGGTVHVIPCWSHFISEPPDSAARWASVGSARSATTPPLSGVFEFPFFSLLERLQRDTAKASTNRRGMCFMG